MKFKKWAKDTALRAVKTGAQAAAGLLVVDQAGIIHADLQAIGYAALAAAGASVLQNLANLKIDDDPAPVAVLTTEPVTIETGV